MSNVTHLEHCGKPFLGLNAGTRRFKLILELLSHVRHLLVIPLSDFWLILDIAYGAAYDFILCLLPITILWNLQMDIKRKAVLYILLGFSVVSGIAATAKTVQLRELAVRVDVTWDTFSLYAWGSTELFVNIVCGSIPMLKPLYDKWSTGRPLSQDSYERSGATPVRKSVGSKESNGSTSKFPWSWKSSASTAVSSRGSKVEKESNSSKEQITIVQSFDVHSNNDSIASSEVVSREMREV